MKVDKKKIYEAFLSKNASFPLLLALIEGFNIQDSCLIVREKIEKEKTMNEQQEKLIYIYKYNDIISSQDRSFVDALRILDVSVASDFPNVSELIRDEFVRLFVSVHTCLAIDIDRTLEKTLMLADEKINEYPPFKNLSPDLQEHKDKYATFCMFLIDFSLSGLLKIEAQENEEEQDDG